MSENLTTREKQILELVAKGYSNKDIYNALCITKTTLKTHITHIYFKIGIGDKEEKDFSIKRVRAVLWYLKNIRGIEL